jgi:hypothetical protein
VDLPIFSFQYFIVGQIIIASHGHDLYIHSFLYILCWSHECCIMSLKADLLSALFTQQLMGLDGAGRFAIRAYQFISTSIPYDFFLSTLTDTIYINTILQFSSHTSQRVAITQVDSLTSFISYVLSRCKKGLTSVISMKVGSIS